VVIARVLRTSCLVGVLGLLGMIGFASISACTLLEDDPPKNVCTKNSDCFQAQGEVCNLDKKVCEPKMDAGVVRQAPDEPTAVDGVQATSAVQEAP
jgi:hypothetical protein